MKLSLFSRSVAVAASALTVVACTMKEQEPPPLSGPSEFGQSITLSVSPDILTQDGASQSVITVTARGPNANPIPNLSLRAEILVGGVTADFGRLSARSLVTDANGRATAVYTAPASPVGPFVDEFTLVNIAVTPLGSDFGNSATRTTTLRLVPPGGIIAPPDGLQPAFVFTPSAPTDNQNVLFDATSSQAPPSNPIVQFRWNFGDGGTGTGVTTTYAYRTPGTFTVTLTVVDGFGRSRSTSQSIAVTGGVNPTPRFTSSPSNPLVNQQVNFNAAQSTAAPGRRIVRYVWDFGDGSPGATGQQASHIFTSANEYVVTLTVTDDGGRSASTSSTVRVSSVP